MKIKTRPRAEAGIQAEQRAAAASLGFILRAARARQGLTRKELADRILIGPATLQRMEAGDPRVSLGYYLAAGTTLGVPVLSTASPSALEPVVRALKPRARKRKSDWF